MTSMAPARAWHYLRGMKFTIEIFWVTPKGAIEPLFPIPLPPLELGSSAHARDVATKLVGHQDIPAHSLTLKSEDGSVSERWFWMDGEWRRKDA